MLDFTMKLPGSPNFDSFQQACFRAWEQLIICRPQAGRYLRLRIKLEGYVVTSFGAAVSFFKALAVTICIEV